MRKHLLCALVVCLTLLPFPAFAQKSTGTIRGVVTDHTGAALAGAKVKVQNKGTGELRDVTTNQQGEYIAADLPVGFYDVTIQQPNFKEVVSRGVELHVASTAVVNAVLQVGNVEEKIEVAANAIQVETTTGTVGNVVDGTSVRELPLNGRSFAQLTQLMPGVSAAANFDSKNKGLEAGVDFSVNGNSTTGNIFLVDGVNNNDVGSNRTIMVYPSIDAIQEFKILRNSYGPEYGQAMGAVVSIVTRGGTNSLHGGAFYFGRNDLLNATDYFNNLNGSPKDKLRRNDFGYNVGGPIKKDKLFFFWSQEWNRELRGKLRTASVPTQAEQNGDFSVLRPGFANDGKTPCDPIPTVGGVAGGTRLTTVPSVSPAGKLMVNLLPLPNKTSGIVNCQNWVQSLTSPVHWREENVRVDYNLSKTWILFGRYTQDHWAQPFPSTLGFWGDDQYPSVEGNWNQPGYQATIKLTKLLGNSGVNDFQISYAANRITVTQGGTNPGLQQQIAQAFQPYFPENQKFAGANIGYPVFWGGLGAGSFSGTGANDLWTIGPWKNNQELYVLKDDFSKVAGNHTFKVGFLYSTNKKNELVNASSAENAQFWGVNSGNTGNGIFNALQRGTEWGFSELQTNPYSETRWHDIETYVGDNWKVRRNLTLEYGFRWSFLRNPFSAVDKIASFVPAFYNPALGKDPCNGLLVVPGTSFCKNAGFSAGTPGPNRSLKDQNNHAIAPRVGVAWDPWSDGKTSFRAGLGQFYQRERLNNYLQIAANAPFSLTAGGARTFDAPPAAGSITASGAPSYGISTDSNLPNTWQWNMTVERELTRDTKLELAYVGNRGIHLLQFTDANEVPASQRLAFTTAVDATGKSFTNNALRPYGAGNWGFITGANWTGDSNYHALQALFRTKAIKGLDAQFAYTWSKSLASTDINNSGNNNPTTLQLDPNNPHLNYGPTQINRPHILTANMVYSAPKLPGQNALVKGVLGGWEFATILSYASGPSMTIFAGNNVSNLSGGLSGNGTSQNNVRPNVVPGQDCRAPAGSPKTQWLNPNRWTLVGYKLGTFGNASVGECSGPGLANTDFSVYKNFSVTERVGLQFRMEFYNLFNKTQFLANTTGTSNIGNVLSNSVTPCGVAGLAAAQSTACAGLPANTVTWDSANTRNSSFGVATKDRGPREIQYALKFTF